MLHLPCIVRRIWIVFLFFHSQIFCIRGDCGLPPVIEHTLPATVTSGATGDTFVYECDESTGYYKLPDKSRTITCQSDGNWTSVLEFCARACGVPERLNYAVPKDSDLKDIYLPGTKVSFDCRLGYMRVPRSTNSITCLDDYTWSKPSEFCTRRSCGNPGDAQNADFEAPDGFVFGSRVTYTCNPGYRLLSRRSYRDCQADGTWSNDVPTCEAVVCPKPEPPVNGMYDPEKDEYSYQEAVTFRCNKDLHLIGSATASCTSDGTWSATSPTCRAITCEDPGSIQNGIRRSGFGVQFTLNSAVRYECNENFLMNGSDLITCNVNSQWTPGIPECLSFCITPPNDYDYAVLEEQHISGRNYFDKTTVDYKCKPGYEKDPKKDTQIICRGRSWSSLAEFCSPISCGDPGEVLNADRLASKFTFGSRVEYKCRQGYIMTTRSYKECQADQKWSPEELICTGTCQFPSVATHNLKPVKPGTTGIQNVYVHNEVVALECNDGFGFDVNGSSSVTCNSERRWQPSIPTCKELHPPMPNYIIIVICVAVVVLIGAAGVCCWCCCVTKKKSGKSKQNTPDVQYVACKDA